MTVMQIKKKLVFMRDLACSDSFICCFVLKLVKIAGCKAENRK